MAHEIHQPTTCQVNNEASRLCHKCEEGKSAASVRSAEHQTTSKGWPERPKQQKCWWIERGAPSGP
eukprot:2172241-Karenia_brevis.AAC.1